LTSFEQSSSLTDASTNKIAGFDASQYDAVDGLKQLLQLSAGDNKPNRTAEQDVNLLFFNTESIFNSSKIETEHKNLMAWADKTPGVDKVQFEKDMRTFEQNGRARGLSDDEIVNTYAQMERLASAKGNAPLSPRDRAQLVQEIAHNAADPTSIGQGKYNTCGPAAVESRTYTRTPSAAAKLVTDVALTGKYQGVGVPAVVVDPTAHHIIKERQKDDQKLPAKEGEDALFKDGERSHASEIFQVTAVNLKYAKARESTNEDIRYEQISVPEKDANNGDVGERVWSYDGQNKTEKMDEHNQPLRKPDFNNLDATTVSNAITGKNETDVVVELNDDPKLTAKQKENELGANLSNLKQQGKLPAVIWVDAANEPFFSDSGSNVSGGSGFGHFVTVTDYDPQTKKVSIDNQWDKGSDHDQKNAIDLHDLFIAMNHGPAAEKVLAADVDREHKQLVYDPAREADLARHRAIAHELKPAQLDVEIMRIQDEVQKHEKRKGKTVQDIQAEKELDALIHQEPSYAAQLKLMTREHDLGLINDADYDNRMLNIAVHAKRSHAGVLNQDEKKELDADLQKLPAARRDGIYGDIKAN